MENGFLNTLVVLMSVSGFSRQRKAIKTNEHFHNSSTVINIEIVKKNTQPCERHLCYKTMNGQGTAKPYTGHLPLKKAIYL